MSRRTWSSFLERRRFDDMLQVTKFWMQERMKDDMDDMDDSDSSLSSISSVDDDDDEMSISSDDTDKRLEKMIKATTVKYVETFEVMEDTTIHWGKQMLIENLSEEYSLTHFRFKKRHLQELADKLWPRLSVYLDGTKHCIRFVFACEEQATKQTTGYDARY